MPWQPIETAPTDGTPVLIVFGMRPDITIASYSASAALQKPALGGWLRDGMWLDHPTHWMPLPALPALLKGHG